jgi:uncharacterized protein
MSANSDIVRGIYDAAARGDIPSLVAAFHPEIDWTEAEGFMTEGRYVGPDAVLQGVIGPLFAEFPNFSIRVEEIIDGGDRLVSLGRYTGTHATSGKSFDAAFAHVWTIANGKATTFRQFVDNAPVEAARQA